MRLVLIAAVSYAALFGILLAQALRGVSVVSPDAIAIGQLGTWGFATAAAAMIASGMTRHRRQVRHPGA